MLVDLTPRSRRSLLAKGAAGAITAAAALAANAVPASASTGDALTLDTDNAADATTNLVAQGQDALYVRSDRPAGSAIHGYTGGTSWAAGVWGDSTNGRGVFGSGQQGVCGLGYEDGIGVIGQAGNGVGVYGKSAHGMGVLGFSETASAVCAIQQRGNTSPGVLAVTQEPTGFAIETQGRIKLSTSGLATIAAGTDRIKVTPGFAITAATSVLATIQSDPGSTAVKFVFTDPATSSFTIVLSAKSKAAVRVAYLAIG